MYDEGAWQQLREALTSAMKENDGAGLLVLSDSYYERDADGAYSNLMFANAAVNCLDLPAAFYSPDEVREALPDFEKASPVFGEGLAWASLNCTYWPVQATGEPHRIEAAGAAPDRRGRHHPRPGDPLPLGRGPGRPALLRPPPHLRGGRPHRVRPRQHLHRLRDQHVPAPRHPARGRQSAARSDPSATPPAPEALASGAGTEHPGNCVDLPTLLIAPWCPAQPP